MKILFIGQRGIPVATRYKALGINTETERRVEALAESLDKKGHKVSVTCASPFTARSNRKLLGINLIHRWSLNPDTSGGLLHNLLELITLWRKQPEVVHVHGWRMAALSRIAVLLSPESTFVWTIDKWPEREDFLIRWVAKMAAKSFDWVTVPTREMQYVALLEWKVKAVYVPDGFDTTTLPPVALKHYGMRKGQKYTFTTASNSAELRWVAKAYAKSGARRKLVVATEKKGAMTRLVKEFPFLSFVGKQSGRSYDSLVSQASLVLLTSNKTSAESVLKVMDAGRAIIAINNTINSETIGVMAKYVKLEDVDGLETLIRSLITNDKALKEMGKNASVRARAHFSWARIIPEYLDLYHYMLIRTVPIDSAQAIIKAKPVL